MINLAKTILEAFGVTDWRLCVNSIGCESPECRPHYRGEIKARLQKIQADLCENCLRRLERNPLRCLDCKKCGSRAGTVKPDFRQCPACQDHQQALLKILEACAVPFTIDASMVRGLDYYTRAVFEFTSSALGAQNAILGGGRYDRLVEMLGGAPTPAAGFAIGADRVIEARAASPNSRAQAETQSAVFLVYAPSVADDCKISQETLAFALATAQGLRKAGIPIFCSSPGKSLRSQMRQAGKSPSQFALIIGDEETRHSRAVIKNLKSGHEVSLPQSELALYIKKI